MPWSPEQKAAYNKARYERCVAQRRRYDYSFMESDDGKRWQIYIDEDVVSFWPYTGRYQVNDRKPQLTQDLDDAIRRLFEARISSRQGRTGPRPPPENIPYL